MDEPAVRGSRTTAGCKFAPRCRWAEEVCWQTAPPLYQTERERAVACILYRDNAVLDSPDVAQVFH